MSLTLILMRHAKSSWDDPEADDHDRPLNDRGHASAQKLGKWLRAEGHVPEVAISSSAMRTRQTFDGLQLECDVAYSIQLYHARATTMLMALGVLNANCVLMIGHNPGIADFAQSILRVPPTHRAFEAYPTGATTVMEFDTDAWRTITWGEGRLVDFVIPREIT